MRKKILYVVFIVMGFMSLCGCASEGMIINVIDSKETEKQIGTTEITDEDADDVTLPYEIIALKDKMIGRYFIATSVYRIQSYDSYRFLSLQYPDCDEDFFTTRELILYVAFEHANGIEHEFLEIVEKEDEIIVITQRLLPDIVTTQYSPRYIIFMHAIEKTEKSLVLTAEVKQVLLNSYYSLSNVSQLETLRERIQAQDYEGVSIRIDIAYNAWLGMGSEEIMALKQDLIDTFALNQYGDAEIGPARIISLKNVIFDATLLDQLIAFLGNENIGDIVVQIHNLSK